MNIVLLLLLVQILLFFIYFAFILHGMEKTDEPFSWKQMVKEVNQLYNTPISGISLNQSKFRSTVKIFQGAVHNKLFIIALPRVTNRLEDEGVEISKNLVVLDHSTWSVLGTF